MAAVGNGLREVAPVAGSLRVRPDEPRPVEACRGALQTTNMRFGVVEKLAHELHDGDLVVGARGDLGSVEVEDLCAGKGEEERGIGGDDELGVVIDEGLEESEHGGLALRREGAFGRID